MKILFIPLSDGAMAHVIRCLVLAKEAGKRGHEVLFACTKDKVRFIKDSGFSVYNNGYRKFLSKDTSRLEYFADLRGYEIRAAQSFKPDVIVNDPIIAGFFTSSFLNIPLVYITNTTLLPEYGGVYGFSKSADKKNHNENYFGGHYPRDILFKGVCDVFDLLKIKKPKKYEDLFRGSLKIIPSIKTLDIVKNKSKNINYIGPLFYSNFEKITPKLKKFISSSDKDNLVFLNFGGSVLDKNSYIKSIKATSHLGYTVIVAIGPNFSVREFKKEIITTCDSKKIYIAKYLPGLYLNSIVRFSFNSGGHGVITQSLSQGCPMICFPYNVDQATYAQRIEELNCGKNIISPKDVVSDLGYWSKKSETLSEEDIMLMIKNFEKNYSTFKVGAMKVKDELSVIKNSASSAISLIEDFVYKNRNIQKIILD